MSYDHLHIKAPDIFKMFWLLNILLLLLAVSMSHGFEIQPRILNGIESNPRDFPFFVNLVGANSNKICGGTLISNK